MRDEDGVLIADKRLAEREHVGDHRAAVDVVAVGWEFGRREAPVERGDRAIPGTSQLRE